MNIVFLCALGLPFLGTAIGAAGVFLWRGRGGQRPMALLSGFAAGVMTAAAVWSLILPALELAGVWTVLSGLWCGFVFLLLPDRILSRREGDGGAVLTVLAVTLHNLPEGMAVGAAAAGFLMGREGVTAAGAMAVALGIALQNLPEGAIISLPLRSRGMKKGRAFSWGVISGLVEPVGAALTMLLSEWATPMLPWMLSFSAGAMLYVVVIELIPGCRESEESRGGVLSFALGFSLMMGMDVLLG